MVTRTLFGDETNSIFVLQTALSFLFALFCFVVVVVVVVFFFYFYLVFLIALKNTNFAEATCLRCVVPLKNVTF